MAIADPRSSYVRYFLKGHRVRSRGDLSGFSPPMGVSEGNTGWCGWRTIYQVANQSRNVFFSNSPQLSLDFIAAMWCVAISRSMDGGVYGITAVPRAGFGLLRTYGTVPFAMFGNGVRSPTAEQMEVALEYRPARNCTLPYFSDGSAERMAIVKELIDSGYVLWGAAGCPPFPFNGGEMPPQPLGVVEKDGHFYTIDKYDDAGFGGAGLVGGSTNGVGRWSTRYADFNEYCSPSGFIAYMDPPTYPFPPPGEAIEPKNAVRLVDDLSFALQEPLTVINSPTRKVTPMPWTYALVEQLEAVARQARAEVTANPPVEPPPPPPPPPPKVEYIVNALPADQSGASAPGSVEYTGTWVNSTTAGRYLNDGLYSGTKPVPDGVTPPSTYTFKSPPLKVGNWQVYVWWAQYTARSTSVPITAGGVTRTFNQQTQGSQWVLHGVYPYAEGEQAVVTVSNANGQAAADAVRFVSA
jgi:hypothetical protein